MYYSCVRGVGGSGPAFKCCGRFLFWSTIVSHTLVLLSLGATTFALPERKRSSMHPLMNGWMCRWITASHPYSIHLELPNSYASRAVRACSSATSHLARHRSSVSVGRLFETLWCREQRAAALKLLQSLIPSLRS